MEKASVKQRLKNIPPVAYMLIVIIAVFSFMDPHYFSFTNFRNVLIQSTPLMILAFGQTCIVLTQGTDLSLGAQVSFVTVFTVFLAQRGIITLCRVESGQPIVANGWEFQAVAATLLGGSSLREGKGGVTGTIFGVLLIQIIKNGLNVIGVQSIMQNAIIGSIVLAAIIIDAVVRIRAKE